ncbi:MAG: hypothetical protein WCO58_01940 [bacterium]
MKTVSLQKIKLLSLGIIVALFANLLFAWNGPAGNPIANNLSAPITTSAVAQAKGKTTATNASTTLDVDGVLAGNALGINGDVTIGGEFVLSKIASSGSAERDICVDLAGKIIIC